MDNSLSSEKRYTGVAKILKAAPGQIHSIQQLVELKALRLEGDSFPIKADRL